MSTEPTIKLPNSLEEHWMPFTANQDYKESPRLMTNASGMYYKDHHGNKSKQGRNEDGEGKKRDEEDEEKDEEEDEEEEEDIIVSTAMIGTGGNAKHKMQNMVIFTR